MEKNVCKMTDDSIFLIDIKDIENESREKI